MLQIAKKYQLYFDIYKAKNMRQKSFFAFMATLPHILVSSILVIFYPQQWVGILILGIILPDIFYYPYMLINHFFPKQFLMRTGENMKKTSHVLTFVVILFLLIQYEYILFLAGALHLILDYIGF